MFLTLVFVQDEEEEAGRPATFDTLISRGFSPVSLATEVDAYDRLSSLLLTHNHSNDVLVPFFLEIEIPDASPPRQDMLVGILCVKNIRQLTVNQNKRSKTGNRRICREEV